jgi:hypothetical protein
LIALISACGCGLRTMRAYHQAELNVVGESPCPSPCHASTRGRCRLRDVESFFILPPISAKYVANSRESPPINNVHSSIRGFTTSPRR